MNGAIDALVLRQVGKIYGGRRALADVSARFEPGRVAAVLGPNGAGKSTLLGILATLLAPASGEVRWGDATLERGSPLRARIGYVGHDPGLYGDLTAEENLRLFAGLHGRDHGPTRARTLLERVGLGARMGHRPGQLSGGECQRAAVVRALINRPQLLLADEPTGSLDRAGADSLARLLSELNREEGVALVLVTHSPDLAKLAGRVLELKDGRFDPPAR